MGVMKTIVQSQAASDQRQYKRAQVVLSGCLINEAETLDCAVIDLSITGARVCLDGTTEGKDVVKLRLARSTDLDVEVVWQDDGVWGLRFTDDPRDVANVLDGLLPEECLDVTKGPQTNLKEV